MYIKIFAQIKFYTRKYRLNKPKKHNIIDKKNQSIKSVNLIERSIWKLHRKIDRIETCHNERAAEKRAVQNPVQKVNNSDALQANRAHTSPLHNSNRKSSSAVSVSRWRGLYTELLYTGMYDEASLTGNLFARLARDR